MLTDDILDYVSIESSDETIAVASLTLTGALISGIGVGNTTITIRSNSGLTPYYRVAEPVVLSTLTVTVQ